MSPEAGPVLVVVAHPDDEVLGCGGTIARHSERGDTVHILILAEGVTARDAERDAGGRADEIETLRESARTAAATLGAEPPRFAGLPDNRLDSLDLLDVVKLVEAAITDIQPGIVYTHHGGDLNIDHRIVHQAVLTACRPVPAAPVRAVYAFETVSSTEWAGPSLESAFRPVRFVDITAHLDAKIKALECYAEEMRPFPHARSLESVTALARLRGASAGMAAAEAFDVVRELI